ncbi:uncharacterized protein MELLADRAFT_118604 [Melampsora larici-populina 98AG31]|uniref:NTF2 domain-containing protein n=1 Tax=Melampsora larici-populina (strain 98AG31 / pathotype 3-4-7) TaxID=747676 RepID=F4SB63_MELLP|nr:uncharacterized protein MELLADRAFT_118604 [Melampsora larici-populina 98AG31]EGF98090.1 hypothetical protein MELLADRAFT_118604 [Melampsora larici-populina 98AG31]
MLGTTRPRPLENHMDSSLTARLGLDQQQAPRSFSNKRRQNDPLGPRSSSMGPARKFNSPKGKESNSPRDKHLPSARSRVSGPLAPTRAALHRTGGTKLRGSRGSPSTSQPESAIDILRKLLEARWNPVARLLDLSNLAQDKILKAGGIAPPGQKGAPQKTASAIWKLCLEMYPNIRSLSLAHNNLLSLHPMSISSLVATLPDLENISLAGNRLTAFSDLNSLSPVVGGSGPNNGQKQGLLHLRELILIGNPIRKNAEKEGPPALQQYLAEACRRFPSLLVLDTEVIDPLFKANLPQQPDRSLSNAIQSGSNTAPSASNPSDVVVENVPLPLPTKSAFFDDEATSSVVSRFCVQFFNAFDHDRQSLMDVYATNATFSLSASTMIPTRARLAGLTKNRPEMPAQQLPSWHQYISISRNIARLKGNRLAERIANGPAEIIKYLDLIPTTKHPLTEAADQDKFVVDAWQMPSMVTDGSGVIYLTIHGQFQELPALTVRSFDRTFMLGPAGPASAAVLKGWPCVILTDQLTIRNYSSPSAWKPDTIPTPNPTVQLTPEQQNLINQFRQVTKLNERLALDCLLHNGWNPTLAMENFQTINASGALPPDAFV